MKSKSANKMDGNIDGKKRNSGYQLNFYFSNNIFISMKSVCYMMENIVEKGNFC